MSEQIVDFTPLFTAEKSAEQSKLVQDDIAKLLSLLNTHRLIKDGGVKLYIDKGGYEKIELKEITGYDMLDHRDLASFMALTIANMAHEACDEGDIIVEVAKKLKDFNPNDEKSAKELEEAWLENSDLIQDMLYLYSEYLYRVFLDNPFNKPKIGIKRN